MAEGEGFERLSRTEDTELIENYARRNASQTLDTRTFGTPRVQQKSPLARASL
jgi:hypothetical protein